MYPIIIFGILTLFTQSMAIDYTRNNTPRTSLFHRFYFQMREKTIRFMIHHHYHILKDENIRQKINKIVSKYYDSIYHYYNLSDEERELLENITTLML